MSNLLTDIVTNIGKDALLELGRNSGLSKETTESLSTDALELLLGGVAKNTQDKQEAEKVWTVLKDEHVHNLDHTGEILSGSMEKQGEGILKHIFGQQQQTVTNALSEKNHTDSESTGSFLQILAPLFMGGLAKTTEKTNMDADVLSQVLDMATKSDAAKNGATGGLLSLLDLDKDGKVVDDLPKIWAGLMVVWKFVSKFIKK